MSWIHYTDLVNLFLFAVEDPAANWTAQRHGTRSRHES